MSLTTALRNVWPEAPGAEFLTRGSVIPSLTQPLGVLAQNTDAWPLQILYFLALGRGRRFGFK